MCENLQEASSRSDLYALVALSLAQNKKKTGFRDASSEWRHYISSVPTPTIGVATGSVSSVMLATDWRICSAQANAHHSRMLARDASQMLAANMVCAAHEHVHTATDNALTLAKTISLAPSIGLRNTVSLLRERSMANP